MGAIFERVRSGDSRLVKGTPRGRELSGVQVPCFCEPRARCPETCGEALRGGVRPARGTGMRSNLSGLTVTHFLCPYSLGTICGTQVWTCFWPSPKKGGEASPDLILAKPLGRGVRIISPNGDSQLESCGASCSNWMIPTAPA